MSILSRSLAAAASLCLLAPVPAWPGGAMTFPQVVAKNAAHRASWNGLLAEIPAGDREAAFMRSLAGPATPMLVVNYDGRSFLAGTVCEPGNCATNDMVALIVPETGRMYAVQRRRGDVPLRFRFLGHPDPAMREILVGQAQQADRPLAERLR